MRNIVFLLMCLVLLQSGASIPELSCDFESNFCNFEITNSSRRDEWTFSEIRQRETKFLDGPLASNYNHLQLTGTSGAIISPVINLSGFYCFSLDYYVFGTKSLLKIDLVNENQQNFVIFYRNQKSSIIDRWQLEQKTINITDNNYQIQISGEDFSGGSVALHNFQFAEGQCPDINEDVLTCDFEGLIGGVPLDNDEIGCDWLKPQAPNRNAVLEFFVGTGWWIDRTTMSNFGNYLYTGYGGDHAAAILNVKPIYPDDGAQCLSFWILFQGGDTYEIFEQGINTTITNLLYRHHAEDDGSYWRYKAIDIDPIVPLNVYMKLTRGLYTYFDDFKLTKGACPKPVTCDFTKDMCGFLPSRDDSYNKGQWLIGSGRVERPRAQSRAPPRESVNKPYLYVDFTQTTQRQNQRAVILSELINIGETKSERSRQFCLRFTYYAYNIISLSVNPTRDGNWHNFWPIVVNDTGSRWAEAFATVHYRTNFRIYLTIESKFDSGIFEINELSLEDGPCDDLWKTRNGTQVTTADPETRFSEVNFHCYQTGHYIPQYRTCDGVIDCPMGEDEGDQCSAHDCSMKGIPCKMRGFTHCLTKVDLYCNGVRDCDDGIDEDPRMCDIDTHCANYCLNDGDCERKTVNFTCACRDGFYGKRCQIESE